MTQLDYPIYLVKLVLEQRKLLNILMLVGALLYIFCYWNSDYSVVLNLFRPVRRAVQGFTSYRNGTDTIYGGIAVLWVISHAYNEAPEKFFETKNFCGGGALMGGILFAVSFFPAGLPQKDEYNLKKYKVKEVKKKFGRKGRRTKVYIDDAAVESLIINKFGTHIDDWRAIENIKPGDHIEVLVHKVKPSIEYVAKLEVNDKLIISFEEYLRRKKNNLRARISSRLLGFIFLLASIYKFLVDLKFGFNRKLQKCS